MGFRGKLFALSLGLLVLCVGLAFLFMQARLSKDLERNLQTHLLVQSALVADEAANLATTGPNEQAWQALVERLAPITQARVTLVAVNGRVIAESDRSETPSHMENHANRPEIRAALDSGGGTAIRYSTTLDENLVYAAARISGPSGPLGVARLAKPITEVTAALDRLQHMVALALLVALAASALVSSVASELATRPMRKLVESARRMASGDFDSRTGLEGRDEPAQLGRALDRMARDLSISLAALSEERDRLSAVLNGMSEGVMAVDGRNRIQLVNPALKEMLLLDDAVEGATVLETLRNPELNDLLGAAREGSWEGHAELNLGGLRPRVVEVRVAPLGTPGRDCPVLTVFIDITERRQLEAMRREFVANVSHELRTPVTAIQSAAETLELAISDPKASARFLDIIMRNSHRLRDLVDDVLQLSRIESRDVALQIEHLPVREAFHQASAFFRERAERAGVEITEQLESDDLAVYADRKCLSHALTNLIDNGLKYASSGGRLVLSARRSGKEVVLEVTDHGAGIAAAHLPRLFERFYRVDPGRSRQVGGTGLGLAIVKHLMEVQSGSVTVESTLGEGTTFGLHLPAEPWEPSSRVPQLKRGAAAKGRGPRAPLANGPAFDED